MNAQSIYEKMVEAGVQIDHHESDLYVPVNDVTAVIIAGYQHKSNVQLFTSAIDGKPWYDIPFAYDPYWINKQRRG